MGQYARTSNGYVFDTNTFIGVYDDGQDYDNHGNPLITLAGKIKGDVKLVKVKSCNIHWFFLEEDKDCDLGI